MTRRKMRRLHRAGDVESIVTKGKRALEVLAKLSAHNYPHPAHPERNPIRRLALYDQHIRHLLDYVVTILDLNRNLASMSLLETPNQNLPWDQDEDQALVESRAEGEPIHQIANELGRTPAACATRLSVLTGIPRSDIVDAYLEGELDNQPVRGIFHGHAIPVRGRLS